MSPLKTYYNPLISLKLIYIINIDMELNFEDIIELDEGMVCKKSLSKKFWEGLEEKHNLTYEDIIEQGWAYAGGTIFGRHLNYLKTILKENINLQQPPHLEKCVCDHDICYNCYIVDKAKTRMIVIGSCCINSFMPEGKKGRTCGVCGESHRNRKDNMCKECRNKIVPKKVKTCEICGKSHRNRKVNKCNDCKHICSRCKTYITSRFGYEKYERCRSCEYIKECIKCKKEHKNSVDKCDHCCNRFKCGVCADCGKSINEKYKRCYTCYQPKLCENSEKILAHFK